MGTESTMRVKGSPDGVITATRMTMPTMAYWRPARRVLFSRIPNHDRRSGLLLLLLYGVLYAVVL